MPYITWMDRKEYDKQLDNWPMAINTKGELEYCIFKLMIRFMLDKTFTYTNLHDAVYAAQHCADEFRRRYLDKREDHALLKNGDIECV